MSSYSIIEYFGGNNDGKCGYCKKTGNYNSHGFWAHTMNVSDYQGLIDRNWRRSGQYCYIPNNKNTCCPMYTIKCDALNFKLSRSHKKIIKKVNQFLRDGTKEKNRTKSTEATLSNEQPVPSKQHTSLDVKELSKLKKEEEGTSSSMSIDGEVNHTIDDDSKKSNVTQKNIRPMKAKYLRIERKKAKLAAKGLTLEDVKKPNKSAPKSLEDLLGGEPKNGKHKLEIKLVSVSAAQGSNINVSYNLFCKYETKIHNSSDNEFTSYSQFLVDSPLKFSKDSNSPPEGFGSFHYQYYLDGELIAVGVIDILPLCVSSVYFYYNPDYSFLSLGTYASLREIALVRELSKSCPLLKHYYLGFYIPTCPKMRYKANVKPSYLLCPEIFTWHLLDENLCKEIDDVHYLKINKNEKDKDEVTEDDLLHVMVLFNRTAMKYRDYKKMLRSAKKTTNDGDEILEYASKVGKKLSQSMLLFRC